MSWVKNIFSKQQGCHGSKNVPSKMDIRFETVAKISLDKEDENVKQVTLLVIGTYRLISLKLYHQNSTY